MIVNPGIRRFLGSAIQRLFNSAAFYAPLTHSAIPTRAASGTTATFTRATTSTWPNNDGYMVTGVAGEIGFVGARRVRNLLTYTENFSNAAWTKTATAVSASSEIAPDGTTSAVLITDDGTVANHGITQTITPTGPSRIASVYAKAGTGSFIQFYTDFVGTDYANFDLSAGLVGNVGATGVAAIESVGDGWYRCSLRTGSSSSQYITIKIVASGTSVRAESRASAQTVNIWHPQLEDVTAQTTQTAGEYVSVGVESAPYYHGSFVDGVACFDYYYLD